MCTGAELALLAGATGVVGGSVLQGQAQARKSEAANQFVQQQNLANQAERLRQESLEGRRAQTFEEALEMMRRDRQQGELDDATDSRMQLIEENTGLPQQAGDYESPASRGTPRVVRDYADERQGEANDFASLLGNARARMGAWGDAMIPFGEGMSNASFDMDELGRQAMVSGRLNRDSARVAEQEAQAAFDRTGNKTAMAGNLATQLGGMALSGGAQSHFGGGGDLSSLFRSGGGAGQFGGGAPGNIYGYYQGTPGGLY